MQFYSPVGYLQGTKQQNPQNRVQDEDFDAYLLAKATQFVQQNGFNNRVVQIEPQMKFKQPEPTLKNLNIQHFHSDPNHADPIRNYQNQPLTIPPEDIDLYLIKQAEDFINKNLRPQSEGSNLDQNVPQFQLSAHRQANQEINNSIQQFAAEPVQYYTPQPQIQQRNYIQYLPAGDFNAPLNQVQPNQLVLPSPAIYQDQTNPYVAPKMAKAEKVATKVETAPQKKMEFIQKGPRGETLHKLVEEGGNYYVKRGLTPEAVCNYSLAHLIGVGPPVEVIESDGIKMEEGVSLRQAIKDKMITVDQAKDQIHKLHKILFDNGMAHCDVKFENCLYFPQYEKVLLIDNGDLAPYGNKRGIKTAGANSTLLITAHGHEERNKVGPGTDLQGFMHIMMNALHGH